MADITFTVEFREDGTPVLKNIQRVSDDTTNRVKQGMGGARQATRDWEQSLNGARNAIAALVGALAIQRIVTWARSVADSVDQADKLSLRLGISVQALSEYDLVVARAGLRNETFALGLQRMVRRISEAADGSGEAKDAIAALGLDIRELSRLSPDQQFERIADAIAKIENPAKRVQLAFKLFDSEGVALVQTMSEGSRGIENLRDRARQLGATISPEVTRRVDEANDSLADLQVAVEGIGRTLVGIYAPSLSIAARTTAEWIARNRNLIPTIAALVTSIAGSAGLVVAVTSLTKVIGLLARSPAGLLALAAALGVSAVAFGSLKEKFEELTAGLSSASAQLKIDELKAKLEDLKRAAEIEPGVFDPTHFFGEQSSTQEQIANLEAQIKKFEAIRDRVKRVEDEALKGLGGGAGGAGSIKARQEAEEFTKALEAQAETLGAQIAQLKGGEPALAAYRIKLLEAEAATLQLDAAGKALVERVKEQIQALADLKTEQERRSFTDLEKTLTLELMTEAERRVQTVKDELEERLRIIDEGLAKQVISEEKAAQLRTLAQESAAEKMKDANQKAFEDMATASGDFVTGLVTDFENADQAWRNLLQDMTRVFAQALQKMVVDWLRARTSLQNSAGGGSAGGGFLSFLGPIVSGVAGLFGGGFSLSSVIGAPGAGATVSGVGTTIPLPPPTIPIKHSGGLIERIDSMIRNPMLDRSLPRFQTGGEVPILAESGEFIIRRPAVRRLGVDTLSEINRTGDLPGRDRRPMFRVTNIIQGDVIPKPGVSKGEIIQTFVEDLHGGGDAYTAIIEYIPSPR